MELKRKKTLIMTISKLALILLIWKLGGLEFMVIGIMVVMYISHLDEIKTLRARIEVLENERNDANKERLLEKFNQSLAK